MFVIIDWVLGEYDSINKGKNKMKRRFWFCLLSEFAKSFSNFLNWTLNHSI